MVGAAFLALLAAGVAGAAWQARRAHRAWSDPSIDPGARLAGDPAPSVLPADPVARARALLDASDRDQPWRAPLRPLRAEVPALVEGGAGGLAAEVLARLGHAGEAQALAARLPADDAAACWVRHLHYRLHGDRDRAEAALVAAATLADAADRPRFERSLRRWRRDHPRRRSDAERLWDPE